MLKYNLQKMFKLRGITNPTIYLQRNGFKDYTSYKIAYNEFKYLPAETMEKICLLLNCTPNDLMEWVPDSTQAQNENAALRKLITTQTNINLTQVLHDVPVEKMNEFVQKVEELKKNIS
ncbi:MAG: helix-turn-helix transcriptional regulator [Bacteroidetes bacterium]|nr:helix-turn-helix transcriptional regulator [Bacteroidota bacterium]